MNKQRRKDIGNVIGTLEGVQAAIDFIGEEEQAYADNMPENMQASDKYDQAEQAAQELNDIAIDITDLVDRLNEVTQ